MKELSIEEKAKRYDEAIIRAKSLIGDTIIEESGQHIAEVIFPELKEGGDEKVKKSLIRLVKAFYDVNFPTPEGFSRKDLLDWLKKQGEQKFEQKFFINDKVIHKETGKTWTIHWYLADTNSYYVIDEEELINHYSEDVLESAEQKPAEWSEEDENKITLFMQLTEGCDNYEELQDWLKLLKDRVLPQPKHEWSEEDELNLFECIKAIKGNYSTAYAQELSEWLKSLKDRVQPKPTWRPSDRQMNVLEHYMHTLSCNEHKEILFGLYQDLNKLKESYEKI